MSKLKQYSQSNVTDTKSFRKAIGEVFAGVKARNLQIQQLLLVALAEASRVSNGQPTNNLTWLSELLVLAEDTKGINATRIAEYVRIELCCNSVGWNKKKRQLVKRSKDVPLVYNTEPKCAWYDYGKPDSVDKAFDYGKSVINAVKKAIDPDKGGMTHKQIIECLAQVGFTVDDILDTIDEVTDKEQSLKGESGLPFDVEQAA